jgi:hypothetical protein
MRLRSPALVSALSALVVACTLLSSTDAHARHGSIYFDIGPGYGIFNTTDLLVANHNDDAGDTQFATASFVPALKLGFNLFGWAGLEGTLSGHFWDLDRKAGGGAYGGGVFRLTPLEVLTYIIPTDVKIPTLQGDVSWKDRNFDLGVYIGGGYTIIGEDYAYQGGYLHYGFDLKYFITPNFAIGLDFPFRTMFYQPFRYTNYAKSEGLCTDGIQTFGRGGIPIPQTTNRDTGLEFTSDEIPKECTGKAPQASFFAPSLIIEGAFDLGI